MLNISALRPALAIALGAVAGALSRYWLGLGVSHLIGTNLPLSTLVINLTGCSAMGLATTLGFGLHPEVRLLIITGFMGSYTTFSSYELDSARLWSAQRWGADFGYWAGSGVLGWLCLEGGSGLARRWRRGRTDHE